MHRGAGGSRAASRQRQLPLPSVAAPPWLDPGSAAQQQRSASAMASPGHRDAPELPDFSLLKRLARDQLVYLLEQVGGGGQGGKRPGGLDPDAALPSLPPSLLQLPGKKDLFIEADLMSPLDRIANVSILKVPALLLLLRPRPWPAPRDGWTRRLLPGWRLGSLRGAAGRGSARRGAARCGKGSFRPGSSQHWAGCGEVPVRWRCPRSLSCRQPTALSSRPSPQQHEVDKLYKVESKPAHSTSDQ